MILDTRAIPEGHSTLTRFTELESVKADLPAFSQKIQCRAEIDRTGPTLYVHVWYEGIFDLECARCLNSFKFPLAGDFLVVVKEQDGRSGEEREDDSVDFYFDSRTERLDIAPAFYDEIMTNIPLMPLCSEDCRGIELPADAAPDNSSVEKDEIDPRWEALKKLSENKKR